MKFERIILLILIGIIIAGGFWADRKINSLQNDLAEQQIDTVTIEIPLVTLDTIVIKESDTVFVDTDTNTVGDTVIIHHYPTATVIDDQPLFTGTYTYKGRTNNWELEYKYRNLGIHLEFPDKFDFRKVIVSTDPDLGGNIAVSLNEDYKPYKPPKGIGFWGGIGYIADKDTDRVYVTLGLSWRKTYVGVTRSTIGWGFEAKRIIWSF